MLRYGVTGLIAPFLVLFLLLVLLYLLVVLKNPDKPEAKSNLATAKEAVAQKAGETEEDAAVELLADHYDSWEDCFVDIRGGRRATGFEEGIQIVGRERYERRITRQIFRLGLGMWWSAKARL